jgi:hypothetical protein
MSYDPSNDPEFDAFMSRMDAADTADAEEQFAKDIGARRQQAEHPVRTFAMNLPKNIGIGGYKALVNTLDTAAEVAQNVNPQAAVTKAVAGEEAREQFFPTLSEEYPEFMGAVRNFTSQWERNDTMADDITQGVAQFTAPFMGWLKLLKGAGAATKASTVARAATAEGVTAGSAFDPHDGRVADLLELGRESDNRFGELLRKMSPDGSVLNAYIDYMTDRENEGEAEGRFKNVVDALGSSAALAGIVKGAAFSKKVGRQMIEDIGSGGGAGPRYQKGMVAFHGTPHDFDAFDLSKLGTGEGNQTYGHGLYFAEAEGTAKHYRGALTRKAFPPGSSMENAYSQMVQSNWDAKHAYTTLMQKAAVARDPEFRETLTKAADKIKAGNVKQLGKLMTVDIDDAAVGKMLDYDKPLAEQPDTLKKIPAEDRAKLEELLGDRDMEGNGSLEDLTGNQLQQLIGKAIEEDYLVFEPSVYDGNTKKYAAEYLLKHDIPGVRYLDGNSRSAAHGTRNLVLFDDKLVKILKKE